MTSWKRQKIGTENRLVVAGGWGWRGGALQRGNMKELFGDDGMLLYLDCGGGYTIICVGQTQSCILKRIHFAACNHNLSLPNHDLKK